MVSISNFELQLALIEINLKCQFSLVKRVFKISQNIAKIYQIEAYEVSSTFRGSYHKKRLSFSEKRLGSHGVNSDPFSNGGELASGMGIELKRVECSFQKWSHPREIWPDGSGIWVKRWQRGAVFECQRELTPRCFYLKLWTAARLSPYTMWVTIRRKNQQQKAWS